MSGGPSQTTTSNSQSAPWAPAIPMLQSILNTAGGINLSPSSAQTQAGQNLQTAANSIPNFGGSGTNVVNTLLGGGGANAFAPLYGAAYSGLTNTLSPYTASNYTNPFTNPAETNLVKSITEPITNQIGGQFAAAGRDLSPDYVKALSMGLSQGLAPTLAAQYNTNVGQQMGAAGSLFSGATGTAGALAGLNQTSLGNMLQGISGAQTIPGLLTAPATSQLGAAGINYGLPWQNLATASGVVDPIAALGGQQSGTSTTTGSSSLFGNIFGGLLGGAGALGALGGTGGLPALVAMSDVRTKENIKPVGMLFDGTNVYSFRYKADPTHRVHVGLLAQEVEQTKPEAVHEIGGIKFVDYDAATRQAA